MSTDIRRFTETLVMVAIVLLQLPGLGILASWLAGPDIGPEQRSTVGLLFAVGFFAPPVLWLGWLLAIPTMILSPRVRGSWVVWGALAMGVMAQVMHGSVIGHL